MKEYMHIDCICKSPLSQHTRFSFATVELVYVVFPRARSTCTFTDMVLGFELGFDMSHQHRDNGLLWRSVVMSSTLACLKLFYSNVELGWYAYPSW